MKYLIFLVSIIFLGCGSGSSKGGNNNSNHDSINQGLDTLSIDETQIIKNTLRNANYESLSNIIKLAPDIVSFSHIKNGIKYNTVLNFKTNEILANVQEFKGTTVSNITSNEIKYDNGSKINIENYTKDKYKPKPAYTNPKDIIQNRIGHNYSVDKFVYTPQKQGAIVLISSRYGWRIYRYGLENPKNPKREAEIASSDNDDIVTSIEVFKNGLMRYKYITKGFGNKVNVVDYNYIDMRPVHKDQSNENSNSHTQVASLKDRIQNALDHEYPSARRVIDDIKYTNDDSKVLVSVRSNYGPSIFLFDISDPYYPKKRRVVFDDSDEGNRINIEKVYDNRVQFIVGNAGIKYRKTYNFYNSNEIYSDIINNNDNNQYNSNSNINPSSEDIPEYKLKQIVGGYIDHREIEGGRKILIFDKNRDGLYRFFTFRKNNGELSYEKVSKVIINAHNHSNHVDAWISDISGNYITVGYKYDSVGKNEYIVYDYINDSYVSNTTDGAGSVDYSWEDYINDSRGY